MCAIKTFLKPEGTTVPSHATMYLNAASYDFAKKHYNHNNPCKIVLIEQCKPEHLISSDPTSIKTLDFTDRNLQNPLSSEGFASNFEI